MIKYNMFFVSTFDFSDHLHSLYQFIKEKRDFSFWLSYNVADYKDEIFDMDKA